MPRKTPPLPDDIRALSFEDALKALEDIVDSMERGEVALEESITSYERGVLLKTHCETLLANARSRVEKITISSSGAPSVEALDEVDDDG
ncbi:MAG: exodeoxyribonuclease VII small subunit [Parvularculales bacterium]